MKLNSTNIKIFRVNIQYWVEYTVMKYFIGFIRNIGQEVMNVNIGISHLKLSQR